MCHIRYYYNDGPMILSLQKSPPIPLQTVELSSFQNLLLRNSDRPQCPDHLAASAVGVTLLALSMGAKSTKSGKA